MINLGALPGAGLSEALAINDAGQIVGDSDSATGRDAVLWSLRVPTTKSQCKHGGWRTYIGFKNQGACVSFVATAHAGRVKGR